MSEENNVVDLNEKIEAAVAVAAEKAAPVVDTRTPHEVAKSQKQRARRQRLAKRLRAKLNAKTGAKQTRPTLSFNQMVELNVQRQTQGAISQEIQFLEQRLNQNIKYTLQFYTMKVASMEKVLIEKLGETQDSLNERLLAYEDESEGVLKSEILPVAAGSYVRLDVTGLSTEEDKRAGVQPMRIRNIGSTPAELHAEFEAQVIGMKMGETKEIKVNLNGSDQLYLVKVTRNSIRKEEPKTEDAATASITAPSAE